MPSTKAARIIIGAAVLVLGKTTAHSHTTERSNRRLSTAATSPATRVDLTPARIVGGEKAKEYTAYGFSVGQFLCGGTRIHDDILLTAAHCQGVFLDGVFLGGTTIDGAGSEEIMVLEELPHEDFEEEEYKNDIMIVKLAWAPADDSSITIQPLDSGEDTPETGDALTAIGYGYTSEFGQVSSILREVDLDVVSHEACDNFYGTIVEDTMMCTLTESKDTCLGDSGGPLLDKDGIQIAITSFGRGCARKGSPGVYTRVASYSEWIDQMICAHSDFPPARCMANGERRPTKDLATSTPSTLPTSVPSFSPSHQPVSQDHPPVASVSQATLDLNAPSATPTKEADSDESIREAISSRCKDLEDDESGVSAMLRRSFCTFLIVLGRGR